MQFASACLAFTAIFALAPSRAGAQISVASEPHEGIVVHAVGTATGRPTHVEMSGKLSADAELAADAIVKFNDAKKRAMAALDGLKNPDLSVKSGGVSIATGMDSNTQQMMAMRGMATSAAGQKVRITETSRIVLANADKLSTQELLDKLLKVLDVAKDAGFVFSQPYTNDYYEMQARAMEGDIVVTFKMLDSSALRDKAYKAAIDDAKARAEKLAELSGTKLGRILSVQESGAGGENNMINAYVVYMNRRTGNTEDALSGVTSGELTMRVALTVQFELVAGK
jgi:uncharacterized protein YggE